MSSPPQPPRETTQNVSRNHVDFRGPRMVAEVDSSSDWLAPRAGANLRQATVKIVSKHGLRNVARAARAARSRSPFMQDYQGLQPDQSIHPNQPFRLGLLRHLLQVMQDPDLGLIDTAESGFHTDVFEPIQFSGIWHRQTAEAKEDLHFEVYDTNRKSAEEDPDTVSRLIQEDVDANFRSGVPR